MIRICELNISGPCLTGIIYDEREVPYSVRTGVINISFDGYCMTESICKTYMRNCCASSVYAITEEPG